MTDLIARATAAIARVEMAQPLGRITNVSGEMVLVAGFGDRIGLGDRVELMRGADHVPGEVIRVARDHVAILPEEPAEGLIVGARVRRMPARRFAPDRSWIGRVIDPDGRPLDGRALMAGAQPVNLHAAPPPAAQRKALGPRVSTGFALFDTLLPLARGQRLGLFAGSGVGKSTLLGQLARGLAADVIVIGLVGERGRELKEFIDHVLGAEGLARTVVVTATSDRAPQVRRRCAWAAMAVAEYFRDQGQHVLLLMDSVTRFAEAHRELAVAAGEPAALRGFPASTSAVIARLCERAGPGRDGQGDITAVFSVLVAGSDMEEPVADMLRGVLDGHVVLDREIAERGRFPAVDVVRSVSRSLPQVASEAENAMIARARQVLGVHARSEMMIQAGLYARGSDPQVDEAIDLNPALERFMTLTGQPNEASSFAALRSVLP